MFGGESDQLGVANLSFYGNSTTANNGINISDHKGDKEMLEAEGLYDQDEVLHLNGA